MGPGEKPRFYSNERRDVRVHLTERYRRVLDVGCDTGAFAASLLRDRQAEIVEGIELSPAAAEAEKVLSRVYRVDLSHGQEGLPLASYDLILALDVIEHMQDPWAALERLHTLLAPGGQLVVSIPNVRNFRVVLPLVFLGKWRYEATGLLDRTHLRFFTRSSALELMEGSGFCVEKLVSLSLKTFSKMWWLNLLTLGLFRGFLEYQYLIFARLDRRKSSADRA